MSEDTRYGLQWFQPCEGKDRRVLIPEVEMKTKKAMVHRSFFFSGGYEAMDDGVLFFFSNLMARYSNLLSQFLILLVGISVR